MDCNLKIIIIKFVELTNITYTWTYSVSAAVDSVSAVVEAFLRGSPSKKLSRTHRYRMA